MVQFGQCCSAADILNLGKFCFFFSSLLPCKYGLILPHSFPVCKETNLTAQVSSSSAVSDLKSVFSFITLKNSFLASVRFCLFSCCLNSSDDKLALISCRYPLVISQGIKQTNRNTPRFVLLLLSLNHPPLVAAFVGWGGRSPPSTPLQYCCGKLVPWPLGGLAPRHSTLTED